MAVSIEEARRVARLARLGLSDSELESLATELTEVLERFEIISSVAPPRAGTGDVSPGARRDGAARGESSPLRPDVPGPMLSRDEALANAPSTEDGQFAVPGFLPDES